MNKQEKFDYALKHTKIIKEPKQGLATFGVTNIHYYIVSELMDKVNKIRIREGNVIAEKPKIVAPTYLANMFEGWEDEIKEYAEMIFEEHSQDMQVLGYRFKNDFKKERIQSASINLVSNNIKAEIEQRGDTLAAVIEGVDDSWQISLMKFIVELTLHSFYSNVTELEERGFFRKIDNRNDINIKSEIEGLFEEAQKDRSKIYKLGDKLRVSGLFNQYEDRFFSLFKKKGS